jgi:hypothetical protein
MLQQQRNRRILTRVALSPDLTVCCLHAKLHKRYILRFTATLVQRVVQALQQVPHLQEREDIPGLRQTVSLQWMGRRQTMHENQTAAFTPVNSEHPYSACTKGAIRLRMPSLQQNAILFKLDSEYPRIVSKRVSSGRPACSSLEPAVHVCSVPTTAGVPPDDLPPCMSLVSI